MIGCFAAISSFGYGFANFLNAALLSTPGCAFLSFASASNEGMVACSITCVAVWTALNCVRIDKVGWLNELAAVLHLGSIVVISVLVLVLPVTVNSAPDNTRLASISSVFTQWSNDTGFESPVYVVCIGLLYGLYGFEGFEASAHMAEEASAAAAATAALAAVMHEFVGVADQILSSRQTEGDRCKAAKGVITTVMFTGCGGQRRQSCSWRLITCCRLPVDAVLPPRHAQHR